MLKWRMEWEINSILMHVFGFFSEWEENYRNKTFISVETKSYLHWNLEFSFNKVLWFIFIPIPISTYQASS